MRQLDLPRGQLRGDLADLLGDPDLVIAHRLEDGRVVDSEAQPVSLTASAGRKVSEIPLRRLPASAAVTEAVRSTARSCVRPWR